MSRIRIAVIGAGAFGSNHVRVLNQLPQAELVAVVDHQLERAQEAARGTAAIACTDIEALFANVQAVVLATPTKTHQAIAERLLSNGIDVLVEKPIATDAASGQSMAKVARDHSRILQVGHLERFNPAVRALERLRTVPLFFEIHRLSVFSPRSLDVDVVLDLMIHDLDIVLQFTQEAPCEVRAAGISVLSPKVDIANVRLAFPSGCIANLTASRVSTEKVRKLRLFQPGEYVSIDYARQDVLRVAVQREQLPGTSPIDFQTLTVEKSEPLKNELESFLDCVATRRPPLVDADQAIRALSAAEQILAKIGEHGRLVAQTIKAKSSSSEID